MDDSDVSSGDEDQSVLTEEEEEEEEEEEKEGEEEEDDDDDDDDAEAERRILELISLLQRKGGFLKRTRRKIDEQVIRFLDNTKDDIHDMLCANIIDSENYLGLDSDRDTEEELERTIRFFPGVLSRRKIRGRYSYYPIKCVSYSLMNSSKRCNLKAVSFIPVLARIAIELDCFNDKWRGGLLIQDGENKGIMNNGGENVLQLLTRSDYERENREHHELVGHKYLLVMERLRKMGLLRKEDIQKYGLLQRLCYKNIALFADKRLQFLVEWDPTSLTLADEHDGCVPLHDGACGDIQGFQLVFEYGLCYYPNKKGINMLFRKCTHGITPFQIACEISGYRYEQVMRIIEDALLNFQRRSDDDDNNNGPYNIVDALVTAAIDEDIHLDCVYFLLRRHPDVLHKLLSQPSSSAPSVATGSGTTTTTNNNNNYKSKLRKRKVGS
jgi:hypothetical protein